MMHSNMQSGRILVVRQIPTGGATYFLRIFS